MRSRYVPLNTRDGDLDRFRSRILIAAAVVVLGFGASSDERTVVITHTIRYCHMEHPQTMASPVKGFFTGM